MRFAIEAREALRGDLRLLVMSATIDGTRFAALLNDAPVIESAGKAWPLALRWIGARPEARIEDQMASAILTAWREETGDILAFLPGVGEIERTRERLAERLPQALILPLHGQCEPAAQRAAIRRDPQGRRRVVLATAIAETSLTLDGVGVVVDAGLSRRAEFDRAAGVTRLVTHRASRASADQRAGRAARQGPGVAYRLWQEASHAGRAAFDPPEIETSDLAGLVLSLADWGARDPAALAWLDPPPRASVEAARAKLRMLGALDDGGAITAFGKQIASLPMAPDEAALVLFGARAGQAQQAARLALLMQERGLGGRSDDLLQRLERWNGEKAGRADAARKAGGPLGGKSRKAWLEQDRQDDLNPALFLAMARPDMVATKARSFGRAMAVGGRARLYARSRLAAGAGRVAGDWRRAGSGQGCADRLGRSARSRRGSGAPRAPDRAALGAALERQRGARRGAAGEPHGRDHLGLGA